MGLSLIEPVYFSYLHSLPNKLFEYLAMGLPVVSSDIIDQAQVVAENNVGLIVPFDEEKAKEIILDSKSRGFNREIKSIFAWEKEKQKLLAAYSI
jgi:glycosyltransferase involved in cell wall biosynthesis